jgi:hypothetical protein
MFFDEGIIVESRDFAEIDDELEVNFFCVLPFMRTDPS